MGSETMLSFLLESNSLSELKGYMWLKLVYNLSFGDSSPVGI